MGNSISNQKEILNYKDEIISYEIEKKHREEIIEKLTKHIAIMQKEIDILAKINKELQEKINNEM